MVPSNDANITRTSSSIDNIPDFWAEYSPHTMVALLHLAGFHQEDELPTLIMQHKLSMLYLRTVYHYVINQPLVDNSTTLLSPKCFVEKE